MDILRTVELRKYFGDTRAVDDVDFVVRPGEFLSLVGSNGAGKTTLVNLISAYLWPDSGKILFQDKDISMMSVNERVKAGISRSFQLVNLFDDLTVLQNVAISIFARDDKALVCARLAESDRVVLDEAIDILEHFGLERQRGVRAGQLAQGERKLLDVAVAYALRPRLLVLDEPTSGVSTKDKSSVMDRISSVVRGDGVTAVVIEHDMDIVFRYSDRIVGMHEGRIVVDGPPDEVSKDEAAVANFLGPV